MAHAPSTAHAVHALPKQHTGGRSHQLGRSEASAMLCKQSTHVIKRCKAAQPIGPISLIGPMKHQAYNSHKRHQPCTAHAVHALPK